jgi:Tol biopolymer transport system component
LFRAVDERGPQFSPAFGSNASEMFFHTGRSTDTHSALMSLPPGGDGRPMPIVDDGARNYHVQPSPDGSRIAFDSDRDGERGVYVANRDGTDVHRVSGPGYAAVPTWAPDGERLSFVRAEPRRPRVWNLWMLSLPSGASRRLTRYGYGQTWSGSWFPDGRHICYTHEDELFVVDVDHGTSRRFESPVKGRLVRTPAVAPDGQRIVFQVYRSGVWVLDVASGSMQVLLRDPTAEEFAWSRDGHHLAFHSRRDGEWRIWEMDL